jgi:hypothetical protein
MWAKQAIRKKFTEFLDWPENLSLLNSPFVILSP